MTSHEQVALYRFFDADGRLLYVGISAQLPMRWRAHSERQWWVQTVRASIEHFDSRGEAETAERRAIELEDPAWNIAHKPKPPPVERLRPPPPPLPAGPDGYRMTISEVVARLRREGFSDSVASVRRMADGFEVGDVETLPATA